jgi:hypothetical protein
VQLSLVVLLALLAIGLFVSVLVVGQVAGGALRRALTLTRLALREARPIADLTSGPRRSSGFAGLAPTQSERELLLTSPITGRPCLAYELELLVDGRRCYSERQALPSVLRDGSGELELPLATAELWLGGKDSWRGSLERGAPPGVSEALQRKLADAKARFTARERLAPNASAELVVKTIGTGDLLHVTGEVIQGGQSVSLMAGRPVCVSDRPFADGAKREGMFALLGTGLALFIVSVVVAVASAILART